MIEPRAALKAALETALPVLAEYVEAKTLAAYRARLWSAMLRLFAGGRDAAFEATFIRAIDQQLTEAWNKGGREVGVDPDEMTKDDIAILEAIINNETEFINRLAGDIDAARTAGMTREQFDRQFGARVDLWANRYTETINRARVQMGSKARLEWVIGNTKEKCDICPQLAGIVAFGFEWDESRFHPQMPPNPTLPTEKGGCGGWNCRCQLVPTKKRRTPRALDKLIDLASRYA